MNMYWFNYKTGEHENIPTPSDFANYIPQEPAAQSLYSLYIQHMGLSPLEACAKVLEACVGERANNSLHADAGKSAPSQSFINASAESTSKSVS